MLDFILVDLVRLGLLDFIFTWPEGKPELRSSYRAGAPVAAALLLVGVPLTVPPRPTVLVLRVVLGALVAGVV